LSTSYILINSDQGSDEAIIGKIKEILDGEITYNMKFRACMGFMILFSNWAQTTSILWGLPSQTRLEKLPPFSQR